MVNVKLNGEASQLLRVRFVRIWYFETCWLLTKKVLKVTLIPDPLAKLLPLDPCDPPSATYL